TTKEQLRVDTFKALNGYDWYQLTEDIEGGPETMIERLKSEKETLKFYPTLTPEQITKARNMADAELKTQNAYTADKKRADEKKWSTDYFKLVKELEDAETPEDKLAIKKRMKAQIHAGAGIKGDAFLLGLLNGLDKPKTTKTDPKLLAKLQNNIDTGKLQDPSIWMELASRGVITAAESEDLSRHHENYLKNHGKVNQWDTKGGIYWIGRKIDKDEESDDWALFINTMKHIQRETGWANHNPQLLNAAKKLHQSLGEDNILVQPEDQTAWSGRHQPLGTLLSQYGPGQYGEWKYSDQYDLRIPTADPAEIKFVHEKWEEIAKAARRAGKPVPPKTARNLQLILQRKRGNI
ncbi:MAG: hypothetical protein ACYSW8_27765, partial [Planctomycetota bacterium]